MNDTATGTVSRKFSGRALTNRIMGEAGIGIVLLLLVLFFAIMAQNFASRGNLGNIMTEITINTILAVGMTFVILIGGIDLSVGSVLALAAVVAGPILVGTSLPVGLTILLAVLAAVLTGLAAGLINGLITETWRIPAFIVTLGMLYIARGAALEKTQAQTIYQFPSSFTWFGRATFLGIPLVFLLALLLVIIGQFVLSKTVFGRMLLAIGNNEETVRLAGHRTKAVKVAAFAIAGACVGVGAIVYMARLNIASPIVGTGYELTAIAAVILGGTSLFGGKGSLVGTLLGASLLGVLTNGLLLMGVSDFQRQMMTGAVIIIAVIVDAYRQRVSSRMSAV